MPTWLNNHQNIITSDSAVPVLARSMAQMLSAAQHGDTQTHTHTHTDACLLQLQIHSLILDNVAIDMESDLCALSVVVNKMTRRRGSEEHLLRRTRATRTKEGHFKRSTKPTKKEREEKMKNPSL